MGRGGLEMRAGKEKRACGGGMEDVCWGVVGVRENGLWSPAAALVLSDAVIRTGVQCGLATACPPLPSFPTSEMRWR